jgi:hypothetical protein
VVSLASTIAAQTKRLFGIQNNTEGHTVVSRVDLAYAIVTIYGRDSRVARET